MAGDSNFDSVVLRLPFDGPTNGVDIRDRSNTRKTITVLGNAKLSTAQSKFGGTSLVLDGTGDYLTVPHSSDLLLSGDFTIETWVRPTVTPAVGKYPRILAKADDIAGGMVFFIADTLAVGFKVEGTSSVTHQTNIAINAWSHIAVCRSGSAIKLYLNGVQSATTLTSSVNVGGTNTLYIGRGSVGTAGFDFTGYIDDIRITKGIALYTSAFSVPTEPFPIGLPTIQDTYYDKTVLLLNSDGSTVVDESPVPKTLTASGNAALSKVDSKVGVGSLVFDGTTDFFTVPDSSDFAFGAGDFTIEAWVKHSSAFSENKVIVNHRATSSTGVSFVFYVDAASKLSFTFSYDGTTQLTLASTTSISTNAWVHIVAQRTGTTLALYINGVKETTEYSVGSNSLFDCPSSLSVGANLDGTRSWNGYIDSLRITKGIARYSSTFTPPNYVLANYSTPTQGAISLIGQTPDFSKSFLGAPTQRAIQIVGQLPAIPTAFTGTPSQREISLVGQTPVIAIPFLGTPSQRSIQIVGGTPNIETRLYPTITESVSVVSTLTYLEFISIIESVLTDTSIFSNTLFKENILEAASLSAIIKTALSLNIVEAILLTSSSTIVIQRLEELVSALYLHSSISTTSSFLEVLTATMSLVASLERELDGNITESLIVSELLISLYSLYSRVIDTIVLNGDSTNSYVNILLLTDSIDLSETVGSVGTLSSLLNEEILLQIPEVLGNDKYLAYLLSPETNSVSTYTNYNFNGCTPFKGKYLFYNKSGLYEYGGELDDTAKIRSELETVAFNFKSSNLKQVPSLYLGVNSTDNFILKVRVDGKAEVIYKLNKYTQNLQTQKIDIGKGLIGRYFQFELMTEASEFDLESIEFYPIELRRKL